MILHIGQLNYTIRICYVVKVHYIGIHYVEDSTNTTDASRGGCGPSGCPESPPARLVFLPRPVDVILSPFIHVIYPEGVLARLERRQ